MRSSSHTNYSIAAPCAVRRKECDPRTVVTPDVFVVVGATKRKRISYQLWEEPRAPDFVLEVTSGSTRAEDQDSGAVLLYYRP